jgi:hypothetical protein
MAEDAEKHESAIGTVLGWGALAVFALGFAWYVGAPLIIGERWSDKQSDAIELVKNLKPTGGDTLYDLIRAYSLKAKDADTYVGEFSWSAMQREGPEYDVTLLWTEGSTKKVALWRVNLQTKDARPQGEEAANLPSRLVAGPPPKA